MIFDVRIGEAEVGQLRPERPYDVLRLYFDPSYWGHSPRPVLGQIFEDRSPDAHIPPSIDRWALPSFFAHLLPEADGALRRLLTRRLRLDEDADAALLQHLGRDLPGNVTLQLRAPAPDPVQARPTVGSRPHLPIDRLRFSLAGIQLKFSTLRSRTSKRITLPASGMGGKWILKLPAEGLPRMPENEWAMMTWAQRAGIDTPEFELITPAQLAEDDELAALVGPDVLCYGCRRFDRDEDRKIHIEDFAQVFGVPPEAVAKYSLNYESIGNVIARLCPDDLREYIRRLVFMVLSGNTDAHLKNWSLIYPDGVHPRLSPAYDLVATVAYPLRARRELALRLRGSLSFDDVSLASFRHLAQVIGSPPDTIDAWVRADVAQTLDAWHDLRPDLDVAPAALAAVEKHHSKLRQGPESIIRLAPVATAPLSPSS